MAKIKKVEIIFLNQNEFRNEYWVKNEFIK